MTNDQEYKRLREEWSSGGIIRTMAERSLGKVCYNCGSDECIELHHVVPLKLGGTNRMSNIVVLCSRCHKAAHNGRHINDYKNTKITGRPHKVPKEVMDGAFERYIHGEIGTKECKKILLMAKASKIGDMPYYKQFLKDRGIRRVRNSIDLRFSKYGSISPGEEVGRIEYEDGRVEKNIWEST